MSVILNEVDKQASKNTIYHCLYAYYFLNYKKNQLALIYKKDRSTISRWIERYEREGSVNRKQREHVYAKFDKEKRDWLLNLYHEKPILTLNESCQLFYEKFNSQISPSSVSFILREGGLTWKRVERRAIQISDTDIIRFTLEINNIEWLLQNIVFLDEIGFDSKGILRKNGYGRKGKRLLYRGEFNRRPRISALCFMGVNGLLNCYTTEGTFNRSKFIECCRQFALDSDSLVQQYPGRYSLWIMDGAKIHLDKNLVSYLRSLGLIIVYLPAYAPFFMPIETVFALFKRQLSKLYVENSKIPFQITVAETFNLLSKKNMEKIFKKCGYFPNGRFYPNTAMGNYGSNYSVSD